MNRKNSCVTCSLENPSASITIFHFGSREMIPMESIEAGKWWFHRVVSAACKTWIATVQISRRRQASISAREMLVLEGVGGRRSRENQPASSISRGSIRISPPA